MVAGDDDCSEGTHEEVDAYGTEQWRLKKGSLLAACLCTLATNIVVSMPAPFFPTYAEHHWNATSAGVGLTFASMNAATMVTAPGMGRLCSVVGRGRVLCGGLMLLCGGTIAFGLSDALWHSILARIAQGIGGGAATVSTTALLVSTQDDLAAAIGMTEIMTGVGFIVGPPLSGGLYEGAGFFWTASAFAAVPALILGTMPFLLPKTEARKDEAEVSNDWGALLRNATVWAGSLCIMFSSTTFGFLDPTFAKHLDVSLDIGSAVTGGMFAVGAVTYAATAPLAASLTGRIGARRTMVGGLSALVVAFVLVGPTPPIADACNRRLAWVCIVASMSLMGVGLSFAMVPAMPAMRDSLGLQVHGSGNSPKKGVENALSSLLTISLSGGEMTGPLLGGWLVHVMPKTTSPSCTKPGDKCESAFMWASTLFAVGIFALVPLVIVCVRPGRAEDEGGSEWDDSPEVSPTAPLVQ
eukprot:TRINITY_DN11473_c0_g1_i2.p2 TRINITY_DN11473_c0_g1~~TRINITY_DN11473_c0_g1_i2.p2  ORF type:complete len:486 (+),score=106.82 TRINITY_DN11473_c0_g1_i2:57-1460(+)